MIVGQGERRRRYILCLNAEEAERERRRREAILELLQLELEPLGDDHPKAACRLVSSKRFGPYLAQDGLTSTWPRSRRPSAWTASSSSPPMTTTLSAADIALGYKGM